MSAIVCRYIFWISWQYGRQTLRYHKLVNCAVIVTTKGFKTTSENSRNKKTINCQWQQVEYLLRRQNKHKTDRVSYKCERKETYFLAMSTTLRISLPWKTLLKQSKVKKTKLINDKLTKIISNVNALLNSNGGYT